jgi:murein DD-endopeptidase MepM/ murein hydrolase activator NlpD
MLRSIPAIQPVATNDLIHPPYGFGVRIDPVYKIPAFHTGMDFSSDIGTKVYATGDGEVINSDYNNNGYGLNIKLDHGFSYKTLYAHLSKIFVKTGQKVKRGEVIGLVGSTGKSVGPHLHYEVIVNDVAVNPISFFYNDLSPEQYARLVEDVAKINTKLD